jgi:hypothetical protein
MQCKTLDEAKKSAGLAGVDHGILMHSPRSSIGYCVYEYGMFVPADEQDYFSIGELLIAGPAVFYGIGEYGDAIDLQKADFPHVRWYYDSNDVEAAIQCNEIARPMMSVNTDVIWQWPDPQP